MENKQHLLEFIGVPESVVYGIATGAIVLLILSGVFISGWIISRKRQL